MAAGKGILMKYLFAKLRNNHIVLDYKVDKELAEARNTSPRDRLAAITEKNPSLVEALNKTFNLELE